MMGYGRKEETTCHLFKISAQWPLLLFCFFITFVCFFSCFDPGFGVQHCIPNFNLTRGTLNSRSNYLEMSEQIGLL